jgi:hypothetical protein
VLSFDTAFGLVGTLVSPAIDGLGVVYAGSAADPARQPSSCGVTA